MAIDRRTFLAALAAAPAALAATLPAPRLALGMHSYGEAWRLAKARPAEAKFRDALSFLEYAHGMGFRGVQVLVGALDEVAAKHLRARAEQLGMALESQSTLPKDEADVARFDAELRAAHAAGATVLRVAMLSGRRYETFASAAAFAEHRQRGLRSLQLAEPVAARHGLRIAIENHKDWLVPELLEILRALGSAHAGVCLDTGNSIALLEDPMEVIRAYAPFAVTVHLKDMGVREYEDGFLLSEVPLGEGYLDLPAIVQTLRAARPDVQLNLEMITRDPLRIPCLTPRYAATFGEAKVQSLAAAFARVKLHTTTRPLPSFTGKDEQQRLAAEDGNVRACLRLAKARFGFA